MVPPVESVSLRNVAVALAVGYLFHALGNFFGDGLTPMLWLYNLFLVFVVAGSGVRPVGGTLAFNVFVGVLLAAVGVVTVAVDGTTLRNIGVVVTGVAAAGVYGWRATRRGLWAPVEKSPFSFGPSR
ncbi:hypothetical protein [Halogeometricum luteum]|uniref:Uncharacterized protein n=1 Tax=Halogeometricum luteum TaxID=2950537 RepID=A0ABU2G0V5_9EURY|nr:hypothetical protein [Halogeometricum sp. S3BR5-2]MDS0294417.1 hypothetical protein [Halogeometricum sp. S3BR5-2]